MGPWEAEQSLSTVDGRILALKNRLAAGKIDLAEYREEYARLQAQAQQEISARALEQLNEKIKQYKEELKTLQEDQKAAKSIWDTEKEKLDVVKQSVKDYYASQKEEIAMQREAVKAHFDAEVEDIRRVAQAMKTRHEQEMSDLQARNQARQDAIQAEITALQGKTPAEEALAQLRKEEIMDKLKSGDLSEKEKLQLQAQLERMERQKEIEEKQLQLKAEKENAAKTEAALAEKQKQEQEAIKEAEQEAIAAKKEALAELDQQIKEIEKKEKEINRLYDKGKESIDLQGKSFNEILDIVERQVDKVNSAKDAYDDAADAVNDMKGNLAAATAEAQRLEKAALAAAAAVKKANSGGGGGPNLFTGGPTMGGKTYTVNELGVEGFMSASGKLSEIKAPAFGQWKAPSSGTVIPAHIWAGIKAQGAAGGGPVATPGGAMGGSSIAGSIRALARTQGGSHDVVTNNVTIQSSNPDQTLAQSLVSLRRSKRAKFY